MSKIVLEPYDPAWKSYFDSISLPLKAALQGVVTRVEHVGSTAIRGSLAKPIIDLDVVIPSWEGFEIAKKILEEKGYVHEGNLGVPEREAFKAPEHADIEHHLYVCAEGSRELARHIAFRDYLNRNPDLVSRYNALKLELSETSRGNRARYTDGKRIFVEHVLSRAFAEPRSCPTTTIALCGRR